MAEWKKVIVSGSSPEFAAVTVDGTVTANSFSGDGSGLTGVAAGSINIDGFSAGTVLAQTDLFLYSDGGTEKSITFSNIEDELFGNVSGDATIAAGGALTIANSAVETVMIADSNVTTAKLADDAVTAAKLDSDSVVEASIVDDAVTNAKIADNAVATAQIVDANVTTAKLAADAVTAAKLADNAVVTANIVDDNVTYAKIQNVSATNRILGRDSAGAGIIEEITPSALRTMINVEDGADVTDAAGIAALGAGIISGSAQISGLGFFDAASDVSMGGDLSGTANSAQIVAGAVGTTELATDAVTGAKIADDTINSEHYVAGSIDAEHLASNSVTTAKITDANVTTAKLAADAVTAAKLADDAVVTANIVDANVTTAKIADDAITAAKIADNAVGAAAIAANAVGTSELAATISGTHQFFALSTTGDLTVGGNLSVSGTTATINVTNLTVDDQLILLNSGSTSGDAGFVFGGSNGNANQGSALVHDDSDQRLRYVTGDLDPSSTGNFFIPSAGNANFYSIVGAFEGTEANAALAEADKVGNIRVESSEIYIYV